MGGKGLNAPSRKPEVHNRHQREYYQRHKEKILLKQREQTKGRTPEERAYQKEYRRNNAIRLKAYQKSHRKQYYWKKEKKGDVKKTRKIRVIDTNESVQAFDAKSRQWVESKLRKCPWCRLFKPLVKFRVGIHGTACSNHCQEKQEISWQKKTEEELWLKESKRLLTLARKMTDPRRRPVWPKPKSA